MSPPPPTSLDSTTKSSSSSEAAAASADTSTDDHPGVNVLTVFQQPNSADNNRGQGDLIILDALPYIDQVHEEYEQYATSLIEQEMKKASSSSLSSKRKLPPPLAPLHFRTPFMKEQYERLEKGQGLLSTSTAATIAESTIDLSPRLDKDQENVQAWQDAVKRVKIGYERERIRAMLLELEKGSGDTNANTAASGKDDGGGGSVGIAALEWKMHNALQQQTESYYQALSQQQQEVVEGINLQRQTEQQKQGQELSRLMTQYQEIQQKLEQLRKAVHDMEQDVQQQLQQE